MSHKKTKKISKVQYYVLTTIILTIIGVWFVSILALALMFEIGKENSDIFGTWLIMFVGSMITGAVCSVVMIALKIWKPFWKEVMKREVAGYIIKEKKQHIKELMDYDYSMLPEYHGKNTFRIHGNSFFYWIWGIYIGFIALFEVIDMNGGFPQNDKIAMLVALFVVAIMFSVYFFHESVRIDKEGVSVISFGKVKEMIKWNKIKTVGISENTFGFRTIFAFIYFSTRTKKNNIVIDGYKVCKNMIMLKPRPQVIHCIKKYYDGEIKGLDMRKEWHRYLERL